MLVKGEGSTQNDLDSFRGHLLVGSPIIISILLGDINTFCGGKSSMELEQSRKNIHVTVKGELGLHVMFIRNNNKN